jgi:HAD superfamily hydrolase (TIGR01549 family)
MGSVKAILFDFGGTLDGPTHWLDRFLAQYRAAGIEISRGELDLAFDHATKTGYGATRVVSRFQLTDLVRFLVGQQVEYLRVSGPEAVRAVITNADSKQRHRIVEQITTSFVRETKAGLAESKSSLASLKNHYQLGVVSNFYGNLDAILDEAGMGKLFSTIADSSKVKVFKPDPGIFTAALKSLRLESAEAAMVGDSLDKDCAPAHRLGLRTVWYNAHPNGRGDSEGVADFTIGTLAGLNDINW